ncbi:uncharacterized protein LOC127715012 [Mytilus californianus]|uniref:uncharacterized protein LOC127715012 n=1 Tax=Mytilus californianus TaxID=6549 RepID=UPI002247A22A|nr:uncharacterized protein LOC127715012 [Mytilus californianus]
MQLFLLLLTKLLLIFGNITGLSQTIKGICHSGNLSNIICCRHFEFVDNSCIECEVGYHTFKAGTKCESCPQNLYGQKCAYICNCKENDRCDNKNGSCIPLTTSVITLSEHSTVKQYQNQSTTEQSQRGFDANQAKYVAVATTNYAILIYMICAGLIILVLCSVAAVYKYQNNQKNVPHSSPEHGVNNSSIPPILAPPVQPRLFIEVDKSGNGYELIDDEHVLSLGN